MRAAGYSAAETLRLGPSLRDGSLKDLGFELLPRFGRELVEAAMRAIELIEARRARGEQGAAPEDLHLDAEFEHIGGGRHHCVCKLGLGQHLLGGL